MVDAYGPTETTVYASMSAPLVSGWMWCRSGHRSPGGDVRPGSVVAAGGAGVVGELYVAGAGVGWAMSAGPVDRVAVLWRVRSPVSAPGCIARGFGALDRRR